MSKSPTVSVALAVYNAEKYLAEAIDSILSQTFTDFELIAIDDGSTDRSLKILQHYARRDPRIRLVSRENRGIAKTRNELTNLAKGEFVAVMDADDVMLPDRLANQVAFLRQHPNVVCVGGAHEFIDEAGRLLFCLEEPEEDAEIQRLALKGKTPINHPSAMIRRSALLQVGGYNETRGTVADLDLFLRLGEVGQLANLKATVLKYRQHGGSVSERKQLQQIADRRDACERAWQRRGIQGQFEDIPLWRPVDRVSRCDYRLKWGWEFFYRRQRGAAIVYGLRAVQALPWRLGAWKLLVVALVSPLPKSYS